MIHYFEMNFFPLEYFRVELDNPEVLTDIFTGDQSWLRENICFPTINSLKIYLYYSVNNEEKNKNNEENLTQPMNGLDI